MAQISVEELRTGKLQEWGLGKNARSQGEEHSLGKNSCFVAKV